MADLGLGCCRQPNRPIRSSLGTSGTMSHSSTGAMTTEPYMRSANLGSNRKSGFPWPSSPSSWKTTRRSAII